MTKCEENKMGYHYVLELYPQVHGNNIGMWNRDTYQNERCNNKYTWDDDTQQENNGNMLYDYYLVSPCFLIIIIMTKTWL